MMGRPAFTQSLPSSERSVCSYSWSRLRRRDTICVGIRVTQDGNPGEFHIRGRGWAVDDDAIRATVAEAAPYEPMERWIAFEFSVEEAASTKYEGGNPVRRRWPFK